MSSSFLPLSDIPYILRYCLRSATFSSFKLALRMRPSTLSTNSSSSSFSSLFLVEYFELLSLLAGYFTYYFLTLPLRLGSQDYYYFTEPPNPSAPMPSQSILTVSFTKSITSLKLLNPSISGYSKSGLNSTSFSLRACAWRWL